MIHVFASLGLFTGLFAIWMTWRWFTAKPTAQLAPYKVEAFNEGWVIKSTDSGTHSGLYWDKRYGGGWRSWPDEGARFSSFEEAYMTFVCSHPVELALVTAPDKSPACKLKLKFYNWLQKEC